MKGLILKDLYTVKGYFKLYLIINTGSIILCGVVEQSLFAMLYPCILTGILALSLVAYEERERWNVFVLTLPYTRGQIVASKYLIGLLLGGGNTVMIVLLKLLRMLFSHSFDAIELLHIFMLLICASLVPTAMILPFLYKFGAEKGRIIYYISVGVVAGILGSFGGIDEGVTAVDPSLLLSIAFFIAVLLYMGSWIFSTKIYQKKEL